MPDQPGVKPDFFPLVGNFNSDCIVQIQANVRGGLEEGDAVEGGRREPTSYDESQQRRVNSALIGSAWLFGFAVSFLARDAEIQNFDAQPLMVGLITSIALVLEVMNRGKAEEEVLVGKMKQAVNVTTILTWLLYGVCLAGDPGDFLDRVQDGVLGASSAATVFKLYTAYYDLGKEGVEIQFLDESWTLVHKRDDIDGSVDVSGGGRGPGRYTGVGGSADSGGGGEAGATGDLLVPDGGQSGVRPGTGRHRTA